MGRIVVVLVGTLVLTFSATAAQEGRVVTDRAQANRIGLSPDGTLVAGATAAGSVPIWRIATGELVRTISTKLGRLLNVAFAPTGQKLAVVADSGRVAI